MFLKFVQRLKIMGVKNLVSLICFLLVLACWILFFQSNDLSLITVILAPVFGVAGFVVSIVAIRSGEPKGWAWTLFGLHTCVILVYLSGVIYMAFFWNPRFF